MREDWVRELWMLGGVAFVSFILGALFGHPFWGLIVGLAVYLAFTLRQLYKLHRWLQGGRSADVPDAGGLWGDVFDTIRKLIKETERREDQLTQMLARFQKASAATPDAMVVLTQHDEIEWANPAAHKLLGINYPPDYGMRISNLLRDPDFADYLAGGNYNEDLEIQSPKNYELSLAIQIIPFGSSQKLLIARDVTLLARLEAVRRNFVANISHELRTPLTVVNGYIETLQDTSELSRDELNKHLGHMQEQAARMQRLVNDLLTLSRLETSPPTRDEGIVDVGTMLEGLKENAKILSGDKRHDIQLELSEGLMLIGNEEEIRSALLNLINNAVRYTPDGGRIRLRWQRERGEAVFSVSDSGEGIAAQHIPHLTERFYRVDNARSRASGGTGLGLSIVKHILMRHDAKLQIESQLGRGSTFTCRFPAERVRATATAQHAEG